MRYRWAAFTLWFSQYRTEIVRTLVAFLSFVGALMTERWLLAAIIPPAGAIVYLTMKYGARYQHLGQSMIAGEAHRKKKAESELSPDGQPDPTNDPPV